MIPSYASARPRRGRADTRNRPDAAGPVVVGIAGCRYHSRGSGVAGGRNVAATGADAPPVDPQVECRTMNQPPPDAIRVPHEQLQAFVSAAARAADVPEDQATLLSGLLIASDLRGVLSHGSRQIVRYVRELRSGRLNP